MPAVTRSQSSRRPSDSPPTSLQPPRRRRRGRSSLKNNADDDDDDDNKTESNTSDNNDNDNETETNSNDEKETIQLNLPLALPPPFNRQLLSLCFHASWRTRRRLRIHFSNRSEVLLEDDTSSSSSSSSDGDSDPDHRHDKLTVIDYDPIAVPSHRRRRWLVPLIIACLVAVALILAAVLGHLHLRIEPPLLLPLPLRRSFEPPRPRPRPITLRGLTTLTRPYARLVRLLDAVTPSRSLPAVQREFAELCTLARALAVPPDACHNIVDLLDDAGVHLARVLVGIRARAGPGNPISALRDTVLVMAWGIDEQHRQEQEGEPSPPPPPPQEDGEGDGPGGAWNATAEAIFHAVVGRLPDWWDDHNALAVPLQSAMAALAQARGMEGDVLASFKRAVGGLDPNEFPAEDVFYAYDRLFTPLLQRRDALLTTLEAATGMLDDAAARVYEFNATMYGTREQAKKGTGKGGHAFEGVEVLLGRVKEALGVLEYEMEAVGVRERERERERQMGRDSRGAEEAREVEERRPRRRREREEEREMRARPWWKRG